MSLRPQRESTIEAKCIAAAAKHGWAEIKAVRRAYPDRLFFRRGRCLWVEMKAPGKTPREDQLAVHRWLRSRGETVLVIDNVRAFEAWLVDNSNPIGGGG